MTDLHPKAPWGDITLVGAFWNCSERLESLLAYARPWFKRIAVGVQESPDDTLEVARRYADLVIEEPWHGRGDPTLHRLVEELRGRRLVFVISDDEWPTEELLYSFQDCTEAMVAKGSHGAWFHFKSTIDGIDFTREQDEHLRLFEPGFGWPAPPHSRPPIQDGIRWRPTPDAFVTHARSLDEMMQDYIRRYDLTAQEPTWVQQQAHNIRMMEGACNAIMERKGSEYVTGFDWWPRVRDIAYAGTDPAPIAAPESPKPQPAKAKRPAVRRRRTVRKTTK